MADEDSFRTPEFEGIDGDSFLAREDIALSLSGLSRLERETVELRENYTIGDRFLVKKMLGMGGMGVVYLVHDTLLDVDRALKVMLPSLVSTPEARSRFFREIRALQSLTHPGIVRIFDCGLDTKEDRAYFTMEYIEGKSLGQVLGYNTDNEQLILTAPIAISYISELLQCLAHAHLKVVHRDLKPQNIMVRPDGSLVVLDFGLAKIVTDEQRVRSMSAPGGTPFYMSPEQWRRGESVGIRSDLYSVGVMLYEMLTGLRPTGLFVSPSKLNKTVPKRLDAVIRKCLEPDPNDRHESADELRRDLERSLMKRDLRWPKWVGAGIMVTLGVSVLLYFFISDGDPVEKAKNAAVSAQEKSVEAGAEKYAPDEFKLGVSAIEQAHTTKLTGIGAAAIEQYDDATDLFVAAALRAVEAKKEIAQLEPFEKRAHALEESLTAANRTAAPTLVDSGIEALKRADTIGAPTDQRIKDYEAATKAFNDAIAKTQTVSAAEQLAGENMALEDVRKQAQAERDKVTDEVRKYAAGDVEKGEAAWERGGLETETQESRLQAYRDAATAFKKAVDASVAMMTTEEARHQKIDALKVAAERANSARDEAVAGGGDTYAIDLLDAGDDILARANTAQSEDKLDEAVALFVKAEKEFIATLKNAQMETDALGAMSAARKLASDAREAIPADPEGVAKKLVESGTASWNHGEDGGASAEEREASYRKAAKDFNDAKSQIEKVQREALEMAAREKEALEAERMKMVAAEELQKKVALAEREASAARNKISDTERKYAGALVEKGNAAWNRGSDVTLSHEERLAGFKLAKGTFDDAIEAAASEIAAMQKAIEAVNSSRSTAENARSLAIEAGANSDEIVEFGSGEKAMKQASSSFEAKDMDRAVTAYTSATKNFDDAAEIARSIEEDKRMHRPVRYNPKTGASPIRSETPTISESKPMEEEASAASTNPVEPPEKGPSEEPSNPRRPPGKGRPPLN